jgi:ribosome biogenesis protein BRX1
MASVYKSLSKANGQKNDDSTSDGAKKNKQRVLMLSSRGITYRFVLVLRLAIERLTF